MCLNISKTAVVETAEEDIICYKVVKMYNNEYFTRYRDFHIEIGKTYLSELNAFRDDNKDFDYDIVEEGLHSYCNERSAHASFNNYFKVKCTIPKGSLYYKGLFSECESYASNCLRYDEIIN